MPEATAFTPGERSLDVVLGERGPLPEGEALAVLRRLLADLRALHASGRTHRGIRADAVRITPEGIASLAEPPAALVCGGDDADPEACPPELRGVGPVRLPAGIEEARQALARAGCDLDPRRIDVYQLGTLLCRLLTGEPAAAYLRSPRVKASVPPSIRPLLERALGYHPADRFLTCEEFAVALDSPGDGAPPAAVREAAPSSPTNGATTPHSPPPAPPDAATPADEPSLPLTRLGHYRINRRIGRGGMGDVYLGYEEAAAARRPQGAAGPAGPRRRVRPALPRRGGRRRELAAPERRPDLLHRAGGRASLLRHEIRCRRDARRAPRSPGSPRR